MSQVRIHLTRHGEVHNPEGLLYGRLPGYGLSACGHEMAGRLAEHFTSPDFAVAALVSSPLQRAQETIAPLAAALEMTPRIDERVIEAANSFEGMVVDRSHLSQPANLVRLYNPLRPSWGEPYRQQVMRMRAAIASLRRRLEPLAAGDGVAGGNGSVDGVIVSHQLPIWVTRRAAEGKRLWHDPRSRECTLASVTTIEFTGDEITGVQYAEPAGRLLPNSTQSVGA